MYVIRAFVMSLFAVMPVAGLAQGFQVGFGQLQQDTGLPVEVTAESLSVNQTDGSAVFEGNVDVTQGEMRMTANKVNVHYHADTQGIAKLVAEGDVLLVQGADAAEANNAVYAIDEGTVVMTGNVTVNQAATTITSDKMRLNLKANTAQMTGNVKTIFKSE